MARGKPGTPVICLETNERFGSFSEAARALGINAAQIGQSVRDGTPSRGLHFYRADEPVPDSTLFKESQAHVHNRRRVTCLETGTQFDSIAAVKDWLGANSRNPIRDALRNGTGVSGYHFYYTDEPKPPESFFKRRQVIFCAELDTSFTSLAAAADAIGFNGSPVNLSKFIKHGAEVRGYHLTLIDERDLHSVSSRIAPRRERKASMDITNITHSRFTNACYRASEHLMHDARQATKPEDMFRFATAASYAELYIDGYSVGNMYWAKFLAIFESCYGDAKDIDSALAEHIGQMAQLHAAADISTGDVHISTNLSDFDWSQLPAYANHYMLEANDLDEALVSRRACSLLNMEDKHVPVQEERVTLSDERKDMDAAKDKIAGESCEQQAPQKDSLKETH